MSRPRLGSWAVPGLVLVAALPGCERGAVAGPQPSPVVVALSATSLTLGGIGVTTRITATVTGGAESMPRTVAWKSSNGTVATVDGNGLVRAAANGTATVTATATADSTARASATVTVHSADPTDTTPPTIRFDAGNGVAESAIFATRPALAQYLIVYADVGSGFATVTPVQVIEKADTGGGSVCVEGSGPDCDTPASHDGHVNVDGSAGTQQGYISLSAYVEDRAGNRSTSLQRTVLVDYSAPRADSATVPTGPLAGGAAQTFRAWLRDNLVLASASAQLVYEAAFVKALPPVAIGAFGRFAKSAPGDFSDPFFIQTFRFLNFTDWVRPVLLRVTVRDVAGNSSGIDLPVPGLPPPVPQVDPFARVIDATAVEAPDSLSLTATLTFTSETITTPPNSQVQFYNTVAGAQALVATATSPTIALDPTNHRSTFTWTARASTRIDPRGLVTMYVTPDGIALCLLP